MPYKHCPLTKKLDTQKKDQYLLILLLNVLQILVFFFLKKFIVSPRFLRSRVFEFKKTNLYLLYFFKNCLFLKEVPSTPEDPVTIKFILFMPKLYINMN